MFLHVLIAFPDGIQHLSFQYPSIEDLQGSKQYSDTHLTINYGSEIYEFPLCHVNMVFIHPYPTIENINAGINVSCRFNKGS